MAALQFASLSRPLALALLCAAWASAAPPATTSTSPQFVFDILPDAGDLVTRLGTDCDVGTAAQAQSSSSSFSMILPGNILVSAAFSEARASSGSGVIGGYYQISHLKWTPSPFRGRGVTVTGPNGVTYNIRSPVEADFKVEGPEGTKSVVQRLLPVPGNASISFPQH